MTPNVIGGRELLKRAIKGEKDGLRFYSFLAEKATHPDARRKLSRLAEDEKRHEAILIGLFKRLYHEEIGQLPQEGISALAKFFDGSKSSGLQSEMQYIDLAIEAELSVAAFYKDGIRTAESDDLKQVYRDLADEEYRHFELLKAEKEALGGNYYWFGYSEGAPMEE